MAYTPIAAAARDVDSPVTAQLVGSVIDNPPAVSNMEAAAITNGAVNGAQFYQHALVTSPGDTDALIYDHAVDGTVASVSFNLGTDKMIGFEYMLTLNGLSPSGSTVDVEMRFFKETDAVYTAWEVVAFVNASASDLVSGEVRNYILPGGVTVFGKGSLSRSNQGQGARANEWDLATAQNVTIIELRFDTGNIDGGQIYAYKRATYIGRE